MRLMVVEDAKGMRKLIVSMLRTMGYEDVAEASDGAEAWDDMRLRRTDLLLTDWNMPVMNGIELVEKARGSEEYRDLPILMFTARSSKEDVLHALKAGVDTYIAKPFTPVQLRQKLDGIVGRRARGRVSQIVRGQASPDAQSDQPVILAGDHAATERALSHPDNQDSLSFLAALTTAIRTVNEREEELTVGFLLVGSTSEATRRLRLCRDRVRMLVLDTDLPGGGITLARLASINRRNNLTVFVVCHARSEIPTKARFGLEHLGITIFERPRMDAEALEQLVNEFVLAPIHAGTGAGELPAPDEIRKRLESDIRAMVSLPVLPQVYHQVVALDRDKESDIQAWIDAIELDPLSRAQVIRRARSPIYGFQGEINDTSKAVILLGKNTVKEIIVAGAVRRSFEGIAEQGFDIEEFWLHSVAVALCGRLLSFPLYEAAWTPEQRRELEELELDEGLLSSLRELGLWERFALRPPQDAFIGGMMHDIGKVALIQAYPGLFPQMITELEERGWQVPMLAAEEQVAGGAHHGLVGRILAESWRLGDDLIRAVETHHAPAADDPYAQLLALANFIGGGIYAYPAAARFPWREMLQTEAADTSPEEGANATGEPAAAPEGETQDTPADPATAALAFLPEGLLDRLELPFERLLELSRALAPKVRERTELMRQSL